MSKKKKVVKKKAVKLFSPDEIQTRISQALTRDLEDSLHVYESLHPQWRYYTDIQKRDFSKKYVGEYQNDEALEQATFDLFHKVNKHMRRFGQNLSLPDKHARLLDPSMTARDKILLRARALMHAVLYHYTEDEFFTECKNSGGTSIGVSYIDTSPEAKLTFPISITGDVETVLNRYFEFDPLLNSAIGHLNQRNPLQGMYKYELGSRGTTVDKSAKIKRLIAVEPTGNMFLQQGLMAMMIKRMAEVGLDVSFLPERHKQLAKQGSVDGLTATIDFSSASDCVSTELLEWILPSQWFRMLDKVRCKTMTLNGQATQLAMFSTMGNAGTFPLETLVFWTLGVATISYRQHDTRSLLVEYELKSKVSVFGDDCILPTEYASDFMDICESVGFIVNREKSFYDNEPLTFRESCGGDYHSGYDVRPFYIRAPTTTRFSSLEPWLYTIANSILKKHDSCFGSDELMCFNYSLREIFRVFIENGLMVKLIPDDFPDDAGLKATQLFEDINSMFQVNWEPIDRGDNGTVSFLYCHFQYTERRKKLSTLRYALKIKGFVASDLPEKVLDFRPIRRKGGYVVSRAFTVHWTVPLPGWQ